MRKDMFSDLEKRVQKLEKEHGSLENFAIASTKLNEKHIMKMREEIASFNFQELAKVYHDLYDLAFVDLLDFREFVDKNGECR